MNKYEDLAEAIHNDGIDAYWDEILAVLRWLDEHPDQVPGRTMTESRVKKFTTGKPEDYRHGFLDAVEVAGMSVVPDPEPTNAEKLEGLFAELMKRQMTYKAAGEWLDEAGVKAPGGDDEQ